MVRCAYRGATEDDGSDIEDFDPLAGSVIDGNKLFVAPQSYFSVHYLRDAAKPERKAMPTQGTPIIARTSERSPFMTVCLVLWCV